MSGSACRFSVSGGVAESRYHQVWTTFCAASRPEAISASVAALLVEVLRADYEVAPAERQQVMASVSALLELGPEETRALVEEAERHIDKSHDLYQFTSQINRAFSEAEKVRLLEALWRVADADLTVHKYEEHLIRRVADLLHVRHSDFIATKLRATGVTNRD